MLAPLSQRFTVTFSEAIGMDPRYPPTEGWPHLVEQLLAEIVNVADLAAATGKLRQGSLQHDGGTHELPSL